jgi:hypothetical protein
MKNITAAATHDLGLVKTDFLCRRSSKPNVSGNRWPNVYGRTTMQRTELHDRLLEAIGPNDTHNDVLEAALDLIGFELSLLCPDCRQRMAHAIQRAIPGLLKHANSVAKDYASMPVRSAYRCH